MAPPLTLISRFVGKSSKIFGGLPIGIFANFVIGRHFVKLKKDCCYIATTNGIGLTLAIARALGLVRSPVILIAMGLMSANPSFLQRWFYKKVCGHIHIFCISKAEQSHLRVNLPRSKIRYFPFGVDANFWTPGSSSCKSGYVLAIGNDPSRDWNTLVNSWEVDMPTLKIVTSLPVKHEATNIEVVRGDWRSQKISDHDILSLYRGARCVVVPLKDTMQPAGQSVCLQAMSCGVPVIITNILGIWDKGFIKNGYSCTLVPPGDPIALRYAVKNVLKDESSSKAMSVTARQIIRKEYDAESMANTLVSAVEEVLGEHEDSTWI